MTPSQVVSVAIRLFVIWSAIYVAQTAPTSFAQARNAGTDWTLLLILSLLVIAVALGLMWLYSRTLARVLLPDAPDEPSPPSTPNEWFEVGCRLLGLWLLTGVIPSVVRYVLFTLLNKQESLANIAGADWRVDIAYFVVESLLGIWLLFGAPGLMRLVVWARYAGSTSK